MGVPLWIGAPGWEDANDVEVTRVLAAGLSLRPLEQTIGATLSWDLARGGPDQPGLASEQEQRRPGIGGPQAP